MTGRVQGVGFRYFTAGHAYMLGLTGLARNLPHGQVEIIAEGDRASLEALIAAVRRGPPGAAVRDVRVAWDEAPVSPAPAREFLIR